MELPIVRLEVAGMQHTIQVALHEHLMNMDEEFKLAIESCVKNFDFEAEVKKMAFPLLRRMVNDAISQAVHEIVWGPLRNEVQLKIKDAVVALAKDKDVLL